MSSTWWAAQPKQFTGTAFSCTKLRTLTAFHMLRNVRSSLPIPSGILSWQVNLERNSTTATRGTIRLTEFMAESSFDRTQKMIRTRNSTTPTPKKTWLFSRIGWALLAKRKCGYRWIISLNKNNFLSMDPGVPFDPVGTSAKSFLINGKGQFMDVKSFSRKFKFFFKFLFFFCHSQSRETRQDHRWLISKSQQTKHIASG